MLHRNHRNTGGWISKNAGSSQIGCWLGPIDDLARARVWEVPVDTEVLYGFFVMKFCILKDLKEIIEKLGGQGIVWLGLHDDVENDCQIIEEMCGLSA